MRKYIKGGYFDMILSLLSKHPKGLNLKGIIKELVKEGWAIKEDCIRVRICRLKQEGMIGFEEVDCSGCGRRHFIYKPRLVSRG